MAAFILIAVGAYLYVRWVWLAVRVEGRPSEIRVAGEALVAVPCRVLVVTAHPDDAEWYAGGTLARMTKTGSQVTLVVATDGEKGRGNVPNLGAVRRAEQEEAGRILGYERIIFLGLPDRGLAGHPELKQELYRVWKEVAPEVVFSFDAEAPRPPYIHPDHQAVGWAVLGVYNSLGADVPMLYLFHSRRPNTAVDISSVIKEKLEAAAAHRTQKFNEAAQQRTLTSMAQRSAQAVGLKYGELFRRYVPELE